MGQPKIHLTINFKGHAAFCFCLNQGPIDSGLLPKEAFLDEIPCPGNEFFKVKISHCRLYGQVEVIFDFFKNVKSITSGVLQIEEKRDGCTYKLEIEGAAQYLFYKVFWLVISNTHCSVLSLDAPFISSYRIIRDREHLFYVLYSCFLVRHNLEKPNKKVNIDDFFEHLELINESLQSLITRFKNKEGKDASINGLVLSDAQLKIMLLDPEINREALRQKLKAIKTVNLKLRE